MLYRCEKCGREWNEAFASESNGHCTPACGGALRPAFDSGALVTDPDGRLRSLPSLVAIPLRDYLHEQNPILRLHRLCDAVEILTRFLTIVALGEVRRTIGAGPLPDQLLQALQRNIERPTLGRWRDMLLALVSELRRRKDLVLPELRDFAERELKPALASTVEVEQDAGKERRDADSTESFLAMRNDLAHGLAMTEVAARTLLDHWGPWIDGLLAKLAFLEAFDVCAITGGVATRLVGPSIARGSRVAALELAGGRLEQLDGHVVILERELGASQPRRFLDLWPLCEYGRAVAQDGDRRSMGVESPMLFFRYDYDRLLYAALGVDLPRAELSDEIIVQQFRSLFQLAARMKQGPDRVPDFEEEIRRDADALIGRREEIKQAKQAIKADAHAVLWIGGTAGIGKSFLMARLAADLANPQHTCRIAWRFKVNDFARCNRYAFFRHAVERLAAWLDRPSTVPAPDPRDLEQQLLTILDDVSKMPELAKSRRVRFFLDGLDEIARIDPGFLQIPFQLARPGISWVCAGQPTDSVSQVFVPTRCTIVFPGGLPVMSDVDIRGMLVDDTGSLKYGLLRRDMEIKDARTGEATVVNSAVSAVCDRAKGLPLLVHFVIQDLLSGHFSFEKLESQLPPPGLVAYYDDLLLRSVSIGELQAVLTPLLTAIVWAEAPIDEETLQLLLIRRKVMPADDIQGRALLKRALNAIRMMIRPAPTMVVMREGEAVARTEVWEPYHNDLRQHIRKDPAGIIGSQNDLARDAYCELTGEWRSIPAGHPALVYVLRHGPQHLIAAHDWVRLAALVRGKDFLQATAARLGTAEALENARAIATALAEAGDGYWADLLICANVYCRFGEAIRNNPSVLGELIQRGQVKDAREIIDKQPDEFLRGVLMLCAAPLAEEVGHPDEAAELKEQGSKIIEKKVAADEEIDEWFTPETKELVQLLLICKPEVPNLRPIDTGEIGRALEREARNSDGPRRTRLPLLWQVLAHASSARTRFYTLSSWLMASGLMFYFVPYLIATQYASHVDPQWYVGLLWPPAWEHFPISDFPKWFVVVFVLMIAWTPVGYLFIGRTNAALKRMSERLDRTLRDVAIAIERLPEAYRQRHYARLVRFFCLTRSAAAPRSCEELTAYWTVRRLEGLRDQPAGIADLVIDTSHMSRSILDSLVQCLTVLDPALVRRVYEIVLRRSLTSADYGGVLHLLVPSITQTGAVDLLVDCLERYRLTNSVTVSLEQKSNLLNCLSQANIARAVLASMRRTSPSIGRRVRERLAGLICNGTAETRTVARSPFELALAVMLMMPYPVYWVVLRSIIQTAIVLTVDSAILLILTAGRPIDPYALATLCRGKKPVEIRHILARRLPGAGFSWNFQQLRKQITQFLTLERVPSGWVLGPAAMRYLRQTVIAQNILRDERVEIASSPRVMQLVVSWFIRRGLYGRPADVVLKVMDDRRLLAAASEIAPAVANTYRQPPAPDEDHQQLSRVLPSSSLVLSFVTSVVLSGVVTLCWLGASMLLFPGYVETYFQRYAALPTNVEIRLDPYAAGDAFAGCVFLVIVQHIYPALRIHDLVPWLIAQGSHCRQRLRRLLRRKPGEISRALDVSTPAVAICYQSVIGVALIMMLPSLESGVHGVASAHGLAYPKEWSKPPFLYVASIAMLTANVLVPSLVARWRGSRLLYPTRPQLRLERLWILPQLVIGAIVLAVIAHWQIEDGARAACGSGLGTVCFGPQFPHSF
jgi:hypothetical protein